MRNQRICHDVVQGRYWQFHVAHLGLRVLLLLPPRGACPTHSLCFEKTVLLLLGPWLCLHCIWYLKMDMSWTTLGTKSFVVTEIHNGLFSWWDEIDESEQWQKGIYYALCASYALVSLIALVPYHCFIYDFIVSLSLDYDLYIYNKIHIMFKHVMSCKYCYTIFLMKYSLKLIVGN